MNEFPLESIVGKVTSGSINIDGSSAIRRTCSLSLTVDQEDAVITDAYWAYKNKFKLEIGLKNTINSNYPDIIWFKQGIFAITSFSKSQNMTSINVSISGKDKMCLLNGELGGKFASEIDLGAWDDEVSKGVWVTEKLPLYQVIRNVVHTYGEEDFRNIIINDLDIVGYELMAYKGEEPMYLIMNKEGKVFNIVKGDFIVYLKDKDTDTIINKKVSELEEEDYSTFNLFLGQGNINTKVGIKSSNITYYVIKLSYNTVAGYHKVELTYN